ncbi:hypothetical protein [Lacinutrix undariae]
MENTIFTAKKVAFISFTIGTILLSCYFAFKISLTLIIIGAVYILLALFINLIVVINLLFMANKHKTHRFELLKTTAIVLSNIPIAICYLLIITHFNPHIQL